MDAARAGIGRRITLAVRVAFVLVLLVGGISVLLAWTISVGVEEGRQRSLEVQAIERIHGIVQHFIGDLHLIFQGTAARDHQPPRLVLRDLHTRIVAYEALEYAQGSEEAGQELTSLAKLKSVLAQLEKVSLAAVEAAARGRPPTPGEIASISEAAHEVSAVVEDLHAVHEKKFERAINATQQQMLLISALYVAFAFGGGLLLLVGDRFLSRHLVLPITRLAGAAVHIASGDLSRRVPVRSSDEVGQLSQAFNVMAERLETHETERLTFEAELERQVKERTRELEETGARLQATQAELIRSERIAVTGQIAAGVTHEIRTPLNSLAITVQLLRRELSEGAAPPSFHELRDALATLEYEITRINRILEEFVNFARLPTPRLEPVEIGALLQEILGLLGPQAAAEGVRIEPITSIPATSVIGDRDQLREVFLNLAQNAFQAMSNGGVLGVKVGREDEWVTIAVADSGPGVPEAERELIFQPFVSTKTDGLGLGLPIVARITEAHGGSVSCRSGLEGGAVFTVRLPLARPSDGG
ncbi:MAG: HAMP domain-containing protein [Candidatus Rokubacteria bacterium]|nr:HAMP domain-containing protein [Candidatus Rokubacteria bacterium]